MSSFTHRLETPNELSTSHAQSRSNRPATKNVRSESVQSSSVTVVLGSTGATPLTGASVIDCSDGIAVSRTTGDIVGFDVVGERVATTGATDGAPVGAAVIEAPVGVSVGELVAGATLGVTVGFIVGAIEGANVGAFVLLVASSLTGTLGEFNDDGCSSESVSFALRITVMAMAPVNTKINKIMVERNKIRPVREFNFVRRC